MEIWHNNRCSKSRCAVQILDDNKAQYSIKYYLETPPTKAELKALLKKLGITAAELIRKGEKDYKENFKGKEMSENDWIDAMVKYPKLIERPILVKGDKAVVGRPPENVLELL